MCDESHWRLIATAPREDEAVADLWCVHPKHPTGQRSPDLHWDAVRHRWLDWMGMPLNPDWVPTHWMKPPRAPTPPLTAEGLALEKASEP